MSEKMIENNKVSVIGEVVSEFTFSHEVFGEGFYIADLAVSRLSDQVDVIPLMISERLLAVSKDYRGMTMADRCERGLPRRLYPCVGPVPFLQPS